MQHQSQIVDGRAVGVTFVVGSLFFTTAALSAAVRVIDEDRNDGSRTRWWSESRVARLRWAAVIQLLGTLLTRTAFGCDGKLCYVDIPCDLFKIGNIFL